MLNENKKSREEALLNNKYENLGKKNTQVELKIDEVSIEFFNEFFKIDNIDSGKSMTLYERLDRQEGLLRNL